MSRKPIVLFIVGPPGAGKTTAVRRLLGEFHTLNQRPKWTLASGRSICAVGHYTGAVHDGGDTVPYSGAREAIRYWADNLAADYRYTLLDGARMATRPTLDWLQGCHVQADIRLAHVVADQAQLDARCLARGTGQNVSWRKGARTRAWNFTQLVKARELPVYEVDANQDQAAVVAGLMLALGMPLDRQV